MSIENEIHKWRMYFIKNVYRKQYKKARYKRKTSRKFPYAKYLVSKRSAKDMLMGNFNK